MTDVLTNYEQKPIGRPTFLTVLCILTFIGSGLGLINNVSGYFTADNITQVKNAAKYDLEKATQGSKLAQEVVGSLDVLSPANLKKSALAGVIAAVLCLLGAYMMWNLKKTGFYLYVAGTLVGVVMPIVILGFGNIFALGAIVGAGFFGIVFVILYGVNLKHMR